jgi:hypothetical protein
MDVRAECLGGRSWLRLLIEQRLGLGVDPVEIFEDDQ